MAPACASSLVIFILTLATLQDLSCSQDLPKITCPAVVDPDCGGLLLQCGNLGIISISQIAMSGSTNDVTSLVLDGNVGLQNLDRNSFTAFPNLRLLSIADCTLKTVDIGAFRNLSYLRSLDLSGNGPLPMFTQDVFDQDGDGSNTSVSVDSLNIGLPNLTQLSVDVDHTAQLGNQFKYMPSLKILMLSARHTSRHSRSLTINETSFNVLRELEIVEFHLTGSGDVVYLNKNAFVNFTSLNFLKLESIRAGNIAIIESLHAFRHRNLSYIGIIGCSTGRDTHIAKQVNDGVVTKEMMRNVNDICVNTLRWTGANIIAIEFMAFGLGKLRHCLKVLDLTGNRIMYGTDAFPVLISIETSLQEFYVSPDSDAVSERFARMESERREKDRRQYLCKGLSSISSSKLSITKPWYQHVLGPTPQTEPVYNSTRRAQMSIRSQIQGGRSTSDTGVSAKDIKNTHMNISIGKMTTIYVDVVQHFDGIPPYVMFQPNHLREFSLLNLSVFDLSNSSLQGLTDLKLFSTRRSYALFREDLLDYMPGLEHLDLFSTQRSPEFLQRHLKRLLLPAPALRNLDLGQNGLSRLQNDALQANEKLTTLSLAHNLFKSLPVSISFSPRLTMLDLTYNAFTALDANERNDLDHHANSVPTFALKLGSNPFMCTCQSISFLGWLRTTAIHMDQGGNYSCFTADGEYTYTASLGDLEAMWRLCNGKYFFMVSLTCLLVMLVLWLLVYLVLKFKIHITSVIIGALDSNFRRLSRKDFRQDVFIAYADDDFRFVRFILLRYLEECLGVTTFVHQRDMDQDVETLFDAIHESWRTVLVITTNFLDKYEKAHCVMKHASLLMNPRNPNRLMVLVEARQRHRIPTYVLSSLEDQHIIELQDLDSELTYGQRESLKHRIMSP